MASSKIISYPPIEIKNDPHIDQWISAPFILENLNKIPITVPGFEYTYILTCWNSNIYITINDDYTFNIIETLGADTLKGQKYILIRPSY